MSSPATRPCARCGQPAELPDLVPVRLPGEAEVRFVDLCLSCESLNWTDRGRFVREGWGREEDQHDVG